MTDTKMSVWDSLCRTDPAHTKGFSRSGGFTGTAIKPQWVVMRLTEEFGPCGLGWGIGEPTFQTIPAGDEIVVFCKVSCWHGDESNVLWGVGGDKVMVQRKNGPFIDDEAFKKSFTDAIMNAFKFLGVAADVHMGKFDDNKYVAEQKESFAKPKESKITVQVHEDGPDWYGAEGSGMSSSQAKKDGWGETLDGWLGAIDMLPTVEAWKTWARDHDELIKPLPMGWRKMVRSAMDARKEELGAAQ